MLRAQGHRAAGRSIVAATGTVTSVRARPEPPRRRPGCTAEPTGSVRHERSLPSSQFDALLRHLLAHSVRRGDFTLKSGRKSGWFIDSKQTVCRPEGLLLMADRPST